MEVNIFLLLHDIYLKGLIGLDEIGIIEVTLGIIRKGSKVNSGSGT